MERLRHRQHMTSLPSLTRQNGEEPVDVARVRDCSGQRPHPRPTDVPRAERKLSVQRPAAGALRVQELR